MSIPKAVFSLPAVPPFRRRARREKVGDYSCCVWSYGQIDESVLTRLRSYATVYSSRIRTLLPLMKFCQRSGHVLVAATRWALRQSHGRLITFI